MSESTTYHIIAILFILYGVYKQFSCADVAGEDHRDATGQIIIIVGLAIAGRGGGVW